MTPTCSMGAALWRQAQGNPASVHDDEAVGRHDRFARLPVEAGACSGNLSPIRLATPEAVRGKYPHGATEVGGCGERQEGRWAAARYEGEGTGGGRWPDNYLSPDRLIEAVTVGGKCIVCGGRGRRASWVNELGREIEQSCPDCHGTGREFTVCEKHLALVRPRRLPRHIARTRSAAAAGDHPDALVAEPPQLRLSDLLRVPCPECGGGAIYHVTETMGTACLCGTGTIPHPALADAMEWAQRLGFEGDS